MKKKILFFLVFSFFSRLHADCCQESCPPFSLSGLYLQTAKASFRESEFAGEHFVFSEANGTFNYTYPWNDVAGMRLGAGYITNTVEWSENPFFDQKRFNYISFLASGYTKAMDCFLWSATAIAYLDTEVFDFFDFALYQIILHGKYYFSPCFTVNAGFILELGLNKEMIWPILGFEWCISEHWRLGAVYPFDLALEYRAFDCLSIAAALRFLRSEHRVGMNEPSPNYIFEYESWGGEGQILYKPFPGLCIRGFVGSTLSGDFKVANEKNERAVHFKLNDAFYGGASANWYF